MQYTWVTANELGEASGKGKIAKALVSLGTENSQ